MVVIEPTRPECVFSVIEVIRKGSIGLVASEIIYQESAVQIQDMHMT